MLARLHDQRLGVLVVHAGHLGQLVDGEGREVIIPHHDTTIEQDDHVIIFVPKKRMVREIEKLFQVSATFLF